MIENMLLPIGIVVFLLAAIGVGMTIYDFAFKIKGQKIRLLNKSKKSKR